MEKSDAIIQLLTEIRDNQQEEIAWRKRVIEDQARLQRVAVRRQLLGLVIGGVAIVAGLGGLFFALAMGFFFR